MIYLGNGIYSDAGSSLSHGGPWKDHKYIKIVNGRYIYPDGNNSRDSKDKTNNYPGFTQKPVPKGVSPRAWFSSPFRLNSDGKWVDGVGTGPKAHDSNIFSKKLSAEPPTKKVPKPDDGGKVTKGVRRPDDTVNRRDKANAYKAKYGEMGVANGGPSAAEKAQSYVYNPYYKNPQYDPNHMDTYRLSKNVDDGKQNESQVKKYWNMNKDYLNKQYPDMNPVEKKGLMVLNTGLAVGRDALKKADDLKDDAKEKIKDIKDKKKYGKLYGTIKVTEPSAAQKAQSLNGASGYSKNVKGYDSMQSHAYKAKYGQFRIANGGPSAAEKAQSLDSGKSKNVKGYGKYNKSVTNQGPSAAQKAQTTPYGHSKNTSTGSKTVQYKKKLEDTNYKYQKAVSSQGPSAAQKAQSYAKDGYSGTSKNVGVGTKKVTYSESKYNKSVTNQGPSAAQKAQSYNKAGISTKSKNVNHGSKKVNYESADYGPKKKKKKVSFKKAIEWIKGTPGKVSVKK